jgi:ferredoxin
MMQIRVDPGICQGYSQCNSLLPTLFEIDDDGTARVLTPEVPPELLGEVAAVVDRCPTGAISLADASSGD